MFHHEFVVNNHAAWVKGEISKLEAFAIICPIPPDQFMVSAFAMNFPTATPLEANATIDQPTPGCRWSKVRKTVAGTTSSWRSRSAAAWHSGSWVTDVACVVGKGPRGLCTIVKVALGGIGSWSRSLDNRKLLPQVCHLLLQKCGSLAAQGRQETPTTPCHPDLRPLRGRLRAPGPSKH